MKKILVASLVAWMFAASACVFAQTAAAGDKAAAPVAVATDTAAKDKDAAVVTDEKAPAADAAVATDKAAETKAPEAGK